MILLFSFEIFILRASFFATVLRVIVQFCGPRSNVCVVAWYTERVRVRFIKGF